MEKPKPSKCILIYRPEDNTISFNCEVPYNGKLCVYYKEESPPLVNYSQCKYCIPKEGTIKEDWTCSCTSELAKANAIYRLLQKIGE